MWDRLNQPQQPNKIMNTKDSTTTEAAASDSTPSKCSTVHRDLAIDAAIHALIRLRHPELSNACIQRRGRMDVYANGYTMKIDERPVAAIELDGSKRFTITLIS